MAPSTTVSLALMLITSILASLAVSPCSYSCNEDQFMDQFMNCQWAGVDCDLAEQ